MAKRINIPYELCFMAIVEAIKVGQGRGLWQKPDLSFQIYHERPKASRVIRSNADKAEICAYITDAACKIDAVSLPEPPGKPLENPQEEAERVARFQAEARREQRRRREQIAVTLVGILNEPGLCFHGKPFHTIETCEDDPSFIRFSAPPGKAFKPIR
jgi:hypothetical protein